MLPHQREAGHCTHHFQFPAPNGAKTIRGICKHCGATQTCPTHGGHDFNFVEVMAADSFSPKTELEEKLLPVTAQGGE